MEKLMALEESFKEIATKLERLEKRITALEKGAVQESKPTKAPSTTPRKATGTVDLGQGLTIVNLTYKPSLDNTVFTGEIENGSAKDFQFIIFNVEVLDAKDKVLGANASYIMDIPMGERKPFEVTIYGVNAKNVSRYIIKYVKGS